MRAQDQEPRSGAAATTDDPPQRQQAVPVDAGGEDGQTQSPGVMWEHGLEEGERRLDRRITSASATGFVGGIDVMIGVAADVVVSGALSEVMPAELASVLGAFVFGIGFVLISIGRSELFSENFLIPVGAVFEGRQPLRRLPRLWVPTLAANILGMFILGLILSRKMVLDHHSLRAAAHTADVLAARTPLAAFLSAVIAGLIMTLWTWLGIALRTDVGRVLVAMAIGFTIAAPTMNHVIVGVGELMFGVLTGMSHATWGNVGTDFLLALAGNLVGGTLFVTVTRFLQAKTE